MASHHLTRPPVPRLGFCFSRGLANCAASVGAEGPINEYNSLEIPSGFRARSVVPGTLGFNCEGPGVEGSGSERILRTSAAEAPAILLGVVVAECQEAYYLRSIRVYIQSE